mgnify:CR=1 FL=1
MFQFHTDKIADTIAANRERTGAITTDEIERKTTTDISRKNKKNIISPVNETSRQNIQTAGFGISNGQFIIGAILLAVGIGFVFNSTD